MIKKVRKVLIVIGTFLITLPTKIKAAIDPNSIDRDQSVLYGVPENPVPNTGMTLLNIFKYITFLVALVIGIIVYIKKSKSSKSKKILIALSIIVISIFIFVLLDVLLNTMIINNY